MFNRYPHKTEVLLVSKDENMEGIVLSTFDETQLTLDEFSGVRVLDPALLLERLIQLLKSFLSFLFSREVSSDGQVDLSHS